MEPSCDQLVQTCREAFLQEFGGQSPTIGARAPGRVNIIGEHTDYNEGFVFPMAIPLCTIFLGRPNGTKTIRLLTLAETDNPKKIEFPVPTADSPLTPGDPKWANYVKGVLQHFPREIPGFDAALATSVPLGGGLSSSASLEVATCTFLEQLTQHKLELKDKALLCQKAEHTFANMPCGIMDQFISCMGQPNAALLIDCRSLDTKTVPLDAAQGDNEVAFLVVNSNVKHQLSGSEYPQRRADCYEAAKVIGAKSLREATMGALREKRDALGERVYQRALHVVSEIERCTKATEAIAEGNFEEMGRLMYQSHVSLRDLYEVSCPELDQLVDITMQVPGVYGSRMTGGGFGGCIVSLIKASEAESVIAAVNAKYTKTATVYIFKATAGASTLDLVN